MYPPKYGPASLDWTSLLHRAPSAGAALNREQLAAALAGRRVLITGAGGCLGSALAHAIAHTSARELILLDISEGALYNIHQALCEQSGAVPHTPILANICDPATISGIFHQYPPEIILHAAACKHVPLMEANPFAALANNALGTHILAEAAIKNGCEQMLMVSTDKAVDPSSIMGASKRIAELILLTRHDVSTRIKVVRLGNVLGSSGSVVPLFLRQIEHGGPVTVSHPEVRRYFMTLTEAVDHLLCALGSDSATSLLVPNLGEPIRILDLARFLIGPAGNIPITFTDLRPGDKMEESLISSRESYHNRLNGALRHIDSPTPSPHHLALSLDDLQSAIRQRDLPFLLRTVLRLVPEYQPSPALATQLPSSSLAPVTA